MKNNDAISKLRSDLRFRLLDGHWTEFDQHRRAELVVELLRVEPGVSKRLLARELGKSEKTIRNLCRMAAAGGDTKETIQAAKQITPRTQATIAATQVTLPHPQATSAVQPICPSTPCSNSSEREKLFAERRIPVRAKLANLEKELAEGMKEIHRLNKMTAEDMRRR